MKRRAVDVDTNEFAGLYEPPFWGAIWARRQMHRGFATALIVSFAISCGVLLALLPFFSNYWGWGYTICGVAVIAVNVLLLRRACNLMISDARAVQCLEDLQNELGRLPVILKKYDRMLARAIREKTAGEIPTQEELSRLLEDNSNIL